MLLNGTSSNNPAERFLEYRKNKQLSIYEVSYKNYFSIKVIMLIKIAITETMIA